MPFLRFDNTRLEPSFNSCRKKNCWMTNNRIAVGCGRGGRIPALFISLLSEKKGNGKLSSNVLWKSEVELLASRNPTKKQKKEGKRQPSKTLRSRVLSALINCPLIHPSAVVSYPGFKTICVWSLFLPLSSLAHVFSCFSLPMPCLSVCPTWHCIHSRDNLVSIRLWQDKTRRKKSQQRIRKIDFLSFASFSCFPFFYPPAQRLML